MPLAYRVDPGKKVSLRDIPTDERGEFDGKRDPDVALRLEADLRRLCELQERLYAERTRGLLVVLQAPDTAGKDGVLRKVVGPMDSRGVHIFNFKTPNDEEREHDYLWRVHKRAPARGEIAFFNRSHYEEVLVVRVMGLAPKSVWKRRYEHIAAFEKMLGDEGTKVVKVYLHISKEEQKARLQARLDDPNKHWKFDPRDLEMRARWDEFREAYEEALPRTSTEEAPWYVVPADRKWYRDLAVAEILVSALEEMGPKVPEASFDPSSVVIPD